MLRMISFNKNPQKTLLQVMQMMQMLHSNYKKATRTSTEPIVILSIAKDLAASPHVTVLQLNHNSVILSIAKDDTTYRNINLNLCALIPVISDASDTNVTNDINVTITSIDQTGVL